MDQKKLIIDTDPGIDDAMAILFALSAPEIHLVGLTTIFGNVTTEIATRNALALAELAGTSLPVSRGADRPLAIEPPPIADFVHGPEGFGDVPVIHPRGAPTPLSAAYHLVEACKAEPGAITICAIGPLTNLALALDLDPMIADNVAEVVVMGGSMVAGGNVTAFAEANIWQDPHAAERVLAAKWPVKLVGLDATHEIVCRRRDFAALAERSPKIGGFLNAAAQFYFDFYEKEVGLTGCHLHDPTAIIAAIRPELFTFKKEKVEAVLDGERIGETRICEDASRQALRFAAEVDHEAVRSLFYETVGNC